jgi:hypothetical protein
MQKTPSEKQKAKEEPVVKKIKSAQAGDQEKVIPNHPKHRAFAESLTVSAATKPNLSEIPVLLIVQDPQDQLVEAEMTKKDHTREEMILRQIVRNGFQVRDREKVTVIAIAKDHTKKETTHHHPIVRNVFQNQPERVEVLEVQREKDLIKEETNHHRKGLNAQDPPVTEMTKNHLRIETVLLLAEDQDLPLAKKSLSKKQKRESHLLNQELKNKTTLQDLNQVKPRLMMD